MNWSNRKVLVTGGAGFLGANLCIALAQRGARVTALDGFLFGGGANPANLEGADVELVRADIREVDLRSLCEGCDVVFNLAAQTSHMGGQRDPARRHRGECRRPSAPNPGRPRSRSRRGGGACLNPPILRPPDAPARRRAASGQPTGRQRRLQVRRRAILDDRASRHGPSGGLAPPHQLLRPATAHPRRPPRPSSASGCAACWRRSRSRCGAATSSAT